MPPTVIHQPSPCNESWEAMTPTVVGRHCASCQTQVVDFTRMTDGEVVAFISQYHPKRRCGRFREDQVDRPLVAAARPITGWRRWAMAAVLLLGSVSGMKARAQNTKPATPANNPTQANIPDILFLVQGVVINWLGIHKAGAWVRMKSVQDSTDTKGHFQFLLPKRKASREHRIIATYWKESYERDHLIGKVAFDSTRSKPYRIKLKKVINRNPGFF